MAIQEWLEKSGKAQPAPRECENLVLDGCPLRSLSPADQAYLTSFQALKSLGMNSCRLTTLEGLPHFPDLLELEVHDNKLLGKPQLEIVKSACPNLRGLHMAANRFTSFEDFLCLTDMEHLEELDVELNPFFDDGDPDELRKKFFESFPKLKVLNGADPEGVEIDDEEGEDDEDEDDPGIVVPDAKGEPSESTVVPAAAEENRPIPSGGLLAKFMATDYGNQNDEEEEDFDPESCSDSFEEEDEDDDDDDDDDYESESAADQETKKRPATADAADADAQASKKSKIQ